MIKNCITCQRETSNPKFCSRSCAARHSNVVSPKRKPEGRCKRCEAAISTKNTYCKQCFHAVFHRDWSQVTLAEMKGERLYQKHSSIRGLARTFYKQQKLPTHCAYCGYDKHFEVCHIKSVGSFPGTAKVTEINHIDNLISLCPNHHWELDAGLLTIDEIRSKTSPNLTT